MYQPFIIRVQYYRQFGQHQSSQKVLFPEGGRQFKHIGYLLVLDVCGESRTLQEQKRNIKEFRQNMVQLLTLHWLQIRTFLQTFLPTNNIVTFEL